jgi:hypothetical protein
MVGLEVSSAVLSSSPLFIWEKKKLGKGCVGTMQVGHSVDSGDERAGTEVRRLQQYGDDEHLEQATLEILML